MEFRKAERQKTKMRLGIAGPAGSGKTYSALLIAFGIGEKVAMIDTENGSGDLYAHLGDYDILRLSAPYTPEKYIEAIKTAEKAGYDTIIIDSLSHAWAGEGGLLDLQGKIMDSGKANSYTAWRFVTPKHNALVEAMLQSPSHIIAAMRSKMEYVQSQSTDGKTEIKKVGLAPVQRDGMEYEFTVFFELNHQHVAVATKDRTTLFDGKYFVPSKKTGEVIKQWVENEIPLAENLTTVTQEASNKTHKSDQDFFSGLKEKKGKADYPSQEPLTAEKFIKRLKAAKTLSELKEIWGGEQGNIKSLTEEERGNIIKEKEHMKRILAHTK